MSSPLRALVVSNMRPDASHPERGQFVRDQVTALHGLPDLDVELYELPPGPRSLAAGFVDLRRRRQRHFDVVHAHFSLSALPAFGAAAQVRGVTLHGTDVRHPRTRRATHALLRPMDLVVAVSAELASELPGAAARHRAKVIPVGVALDRFQPLPRTQARVQLGLDPEGRYLLFPADPLRAGKRHDLALALAQAAGAQLLSLGGVPPTRVPLMVNAANAVLVPSEQEGFGLAVLEALACDVPVLATPVGIHPVALRDIAGTLCAPFQLERWLEALRPHLAIADPRVSGRERAMGFSAQRMATQLAAAWRETLAANGGRIHKHAQRSG
ncbi:MAG TPA: glycosyltransferase [Solirubrobacteraceae bacterium]|jgi:glycosyltransferase involved in cell wall biosynthesis